MAGSQLKRLKTSLRDQGIIGPKQSKKQKRKNAQDVGARNEKRLQKGVVLSGIREQFNPFDLKHAVRGPKFEVTSNISAAGSGARRIQGRPGQAKAASEEIRRNTLLIDMQRRNKVGGILDRRFGENDATMTTEDMMVERFALEKQRSYKKSNLFDLEDDNLMENLTHMGKSLTFDKGDDQVADDFEEADLEEDYDSDISERQMQRLRRLRSMAAYDSNEMEDMLPERKKSKKEVMEEIIAKSKHYKYERQAAKEDDDETRAKLDLELSSIQRLLASSRAANKHRDNTQSTIAGVDRSEFDRTFDIEVKRLAQDRRAKPADRTKTEEEIAEEESERLKKLEYKRQKRMRGEEVSDSEEDSEASSEEQNIVEQEKDANRLDDDGFGLGSGIKAKPLATELGFEDEDDFIIDDGLVASGSDLELVVSEDDADSDSDNSDYGGAVVKEEEEEEEEDEFTRGLLNAEEARNPIFQSSTSHVTAQEGGDETGLPFTFPCPQSLEEFMSVISGYSHNNTPRIVQRIRTLYHPKLDSKNKERLGNFATNLVDYLAFSWDMEDMPPSNVLESVVRHVHSLAKMFPTEIGTRFRHHLEEIGRSRPLAVVPSDLVLLTAISSIFPTSDHFHQVVTPAMLTIGRYLSQKVPQDLADYAIGTYLSILSLQYQQMSKRYVPEVMNFTLNAICSLAPFSLSTQIGDFPIHSSPLGCRLETTSATELRKLSLKDCVSCKLTKEQAVDLQVTVLTTSLQLLDAAADLWTGKEAFLETFNPATKILHHLNEKACRVSLPPRVRDISKKLEAKLARMLRLSHLSRRPLTLHNHRPLAIKTYIPKFEETFDPDKHYDPDRERAEIAKLKKEHKRERKGAMRELRKDTNFMAREKLRVKKAKDEAYEKKFKRLVAEIQSEEGKESNAYAREKDARKRSKKT